MSYEIAAYAPEPAAPGDKCAALVYTESVWSYGACARPAKGRMQKIDPSGRAQGETYPFCGRHLAMYRKRIEAAIARREKDEARRARNAEQDRQRAEADNLAQFLTQQLGVKFFRGDGLTGTHVAISLVTARDLYRRKAKLTMEEEL